VAFSPPDLFHIGYHIPFKAALGPTYGHQLYSNDILAPEEINREIERIHTLIRRMKNNGVGRLIPYVYTMAFFGVADTRSGFFNFFDHWNDYRQFGLGEKPQADPTLWEQVRRPAQLGGGPAGILHYEPCINHPAWAEYLDLVVRQLAGVGYEGMFFDVNTLYCFCPYCQEKFDIYLYDKYGQEGLQKFFGTSDHLLLNLSTIYREFEKVILEGFKPYLAERNLLAENMRMLGTGDTSEVHLENDWRLLRCYMQEAAAEFPPEENFDQYLRKTFGTDQYTQVQEAKKQVFRQTILRHHFFLYLQSDALATLLLERFGSSDIKRRCCANPPDLLLWVETQRFWCRSMAEQFARLKMQGRLTYARQGRADDFYTVANLGSMATLDGMNKRRVDGIDLVTWAPTADMQMLEEMNQNGILESGVILSNIFAFKWAMAAGTRAGSLLYKVKDDQAADLAEAEVAAAGGGAFIQPGTGAPLSRLRWKKFFAEHANFLQNGESWVKAGLFFWSDQAFYENTAHLATSRALAHIFSENQVPFDIVTEENLAGIGNFRLLVVPCLRYMSTEQIEALSNYTKGGGRLLIIPPFASEDKQGFKQPARILSRPVRGQTGNTAVKYGKGLILWLDAGEIPSRRSDFWVLMEERGNDFSAARRYLNAAREKDLAEGIDMGPAFIKRIERDLQMKLRWCAEETDDALYLHAYRILAQNGEKEKIVLHTVNYHMPIRLEKEAGENEDPVWINETRSGAPVPVRNLNITMPLPPGKKVISVFSKSPTDNNQKIDWQQVGDSILIKLDSVKIYRVIVVEVE